MKQLISKSSLILATLALASCGGSGGGSGESEASRIIRSFAVERPDVGTEISITDNTKGGFVSYFNDSSTVNCSYQGQNINVKVVSKVDNFDYVVKTTEMYDLEKEGSSAECGETAFDLRIERIDSSRRVVDIKKDLKETAGEFDQLCAGRCEVVEEGSNVHFKFNNVTIDEGEGPYTIDGSMTLNPVVLYLSDESLSDFTVKTEGVTRKFETKFIDGDALKARLPEKIKKEEMVTENVQEFKDFTELTSGKVFKSDVSYLHYEIDLSEGKSVYVEQYKAVDYDADGGRTTCPIRQKTPSADFSGLQVMTLLSDGTDVEEDKVIELTMPVVNLEITNDEAEPSEACKAMVAKKIKENQEWGGNTTKNLEYDLVKKELKIHGIALYEVKAEEESK